MRRRLGFVVALLLALMLWVVVGPAICLDLDNAFLRWLYGCSDKDTAGGGSSGAGD